ncbi:MAG: CCA tRNA nucleotidyltransferase [Acidilobaceae archaeon]
MSIARLVEGEVLEYIRPEPWHLKALEALVAIIKFSLERCLKKLGLEARVSVEGSFAKKTLLSDKREVDVFVLFKDVTDEWIERESLEILEKCLGGVFKIKKKYAQHPYVTVELDDLSADVVPARLIESPSESSLGVSRTPFHTKYVLEKIQANPSLADEIRLLKSFMRGVGVYGAESGIDGFSGYLAELLVVKYGGFREVLNAVSQWSPPVYIDVENAGVEEELRKRYRDSPIIVVDPVDPKRNAAASVSLEKLALFIIASKLYVKNPDKSFFHVFSEKLRIETPAIVAFCEGDFSSRDEAVVLGKLKRVSDTLWVYLRNHGFKPLWRTYGYEGDRAVIAVGLESLSIPQLEQREGPTAWSSSERVLAFISKRLREEGYAWVGADGRLYGLRARSFSHVSMLAATLSAKVSQILSSDCSVEACENSWRCLRESCVNLGALVGYPAYAWMRLALRA